jgi:hypothetical protein
MADAVFGGGGSVFWTIKTDQLRTPFELSLNQVFDKAVFTENGTDRSDSAAYGTNFVVSFLPPQGVSAEDFIRNFGKYAVAKEGRIQFRLPVVKPDGTQPYRPQVQVGWGNFPGAQDPSQRAAI